MCAHVCVMLSRIAIRGWHDANASTYLCYILPFLPAANVSQQLFHQGKLLARGLQELRAKWGVRAGGLQGKQEHEGSPRMWANDGKPAPSELKPLALTLSTRGLPRPAPVTASLVASGSAAFRSRNATSAPAISCSCSRTRVMGVALAASLPAAICLQASASWHSMVDSCCWSGGLELP